MPRLVERLTHSVKVWVPNARAQQLINIRRALTKAAGGLTETTSWGSWTNGTGDVISEPTTVLEALVDSRAVSHTSDVARLAADWLIEAGEKQVLVSVDGEARIYQ